MKHLILLGITSLAFLALGVTTQETASKIFLNLNENKEVTVEPYKMYEVYVPLATMIPQESYWIRSYFNGAVSLWKTPVYLFKQELQI